MTQQKTYKSLYGAENDITISQYIAEIIVNRQSKLRNIKLPNCFWKDSSFAEWTKIFRVQKMRADALKKAGYEYTVILAALNSYKGTYIASLHNKKLEILLEEEQRKFDLEKEFETKTNLEITSTTELPKTFTSKKNRINELRD